MSVGIIGLMAYGFQKLHARPIPVSNHEKRHAQFMMQIRIRGIKPYRLSQPLNSFRKLSLSPKIDGFAH